MTLYWFLLVVSSLALGTLPAADVPMANCLGATAMLVLAWIVLSQTVATTAIRAIKGGMDEQLVIPLLERQLDLFRWTGLGVSAVCFIGFRLAAAVKSWPVFESSMMLQAMAMLVPGVAITASTWFAEHRLGVAVGFAQPRGWRAVKDMAITLVATGGWIAIPVLAILAMTDGLNCTGYFSGESASALVSLAAIVLIPFALPMILSKVWRTRAIEGADRLWMEALLRSCGMGRLQVRVWNTDMKSYNAVIAGFLPGSRCLMVTDRLLAELSRPLLTLVVLHEIAHVKRRHVWLRMLVLIPSWLLAAVLSLAFSASPAATIASNLMAVVATLVTLRWIAHATEFDADRVACELACKLPLSQDRPWDHREAAKRCGDALRWVTRFESSSDRSSWLHPSIQSRCDRLAVWAEKQDAEPLSELATVSSGLPCV